MQDQPYSQRILELAEKWANETANDTEKQEFIDWYNQFDDERLHLVSEHYSGSEQLKNEMLQFIQQKIHQERKLVHFRWKSVAAAAAILLIIATGSYFVFFNKVAQKPVQQASNVKSIKDIKAPDVARATLQLADGSIIYLDSAANGTIAQQNNVDVIKNDKGEIAYRSPANSQQLTAKSQAYNTLVNPKGSKAVPVKLSDGTMVWLNAASSLRYPVAFAGNTRNVEITGEAYFEVAHDATKPFTVKDMTNDVDVQVLGTHFNVNTYKDQGSIRVTLLEGSVKVRKGSVFGMLKPGEQAQISSGIVVKNDIDVEQVMAWKNGLFKFDGEDLQTVMKQIERWYDVEVVYEGIQKPLNFGGVISRKENVSAVLELMSLTKQVRFKIEESKTATAKIVVVQ